MIKSYAGIGSRDISEIERKNIINIARIMSRLDYVLFSGNAEGSDVAFQEGSDGKCVIMMPWPKFNEDEYDYTFSRDHFILGDEKDGVKSIDRFHPNPSALSRGARALMARNYYQIMGYRAYPPVSLVVCCADEYRGQIKGGTGQAARIAEANNIPVINIRSKGWRCKFESVLELS